MWMVDRSRSRKKSESYFSGPHGRDEGGLGWTR